MAELTKYVSELDAEQEKLFNDNFSHKRWKKYVMRLDYLI